MPALSISFLLTSSGNLPRGAASAMPDQLPISALITPPADPSTRKSVSVRPYCMAFLHLNFVSRPRRTALAEGMGFEPTIRIVSA